MRADDFNYDLPDELIAQYPTRTRSASRLLCVDSEKESLADRQFVDLPGLLRDGDLLVLNDTRVIKARLYGRKETGGRCEILIERQMGLHEALAHIRSSKSPKVGSRLHIDDTSLTVSGRQHDLFKLSSTVPVAELLDTSGHVPLPPYIERSDEDLDEDRYQTVYAREPGAVAAPTAGLHFDDAMLEAIDKAGVAVAYITLHVGAGTFQPLRVENPLEHRMHEERVEVQQKVCDTITETRRHGGRIIAVGTTVVRSLEAASQSGELKPFATTTELFIYPGYRFRTIDGLLTNFHLPKSTLLMLVSALAGRDTILRAYRHAIEQRYRFFSYGDAMFIQPRTSTRF